MADEKAPTEKASVRKVVSAETGPAAPEPLVYLYLNQPNTRFELGNIGLPDLVQEGTAYKPADADIVRMMCLKYGIRYRETP
jgi:hypothetical protein